MSQQAHTEAYIRLMTSYWRFRFFLFWKLPAAFFSGVRIRSLDPARCEATVPYKWFSQNPFRSTYFACLAMAAELSTGALSMAHLYKRVPAVSMLVVKMEAEYGKKATGITVFTCEEGLALKAAIEAAVQSGTGQQLTVTTTGRNEKGEEIARFRITWSFKAKQA